MFWNPVTLPFEDFNIRAKYFLWREVEKKKDSCSIKISNTNIYFIYVYFSHRHWISWFSIQGRFILFSVSQKKILKYGIEIKMKKDEMLDLILFYFYFCCRNQYKWLGIVLLLFTDLLSFCVEEKIQFLIFYTHI